MSEQAAWAAGFLEGEGSFDAICPATAGRRARVQAAQAVRAPLDRLMDFCGGKVYGPYQYTQKQPYFVWTLYDGPTVDAFVCAIQHLMSPRRLEQINAMYALAGDPR